MTQITLSSLDREVLLLESHPGTFEMEFTVREQGMSLLLSESLMEHEEGRLLEGRLVLVSSLESKEEKGATVSLTGMTCPQPTTADKVPE